MKGTEVGGGMKGDARIAAWVVTSLVLGVMLVLVLVMGVCATPTATATTTPSPHTYRYTNITHRLQQFSIFKKGTHVLYGSGVSIVNCQLFIVNNSL